MLFVACVLLSVGMLLRPDIGLTVTRGIRNTILSPLLWLQARAEESRTSRSAFDKLREERDSAAYAAQFLPSLRAENQRLRNMLQLGQRLPAGYLAA
ncbi:MAG TPA: hypothetical protein VG817_07140, partial [Gemmatimonadales bacterium]|nr:hypothetical protein [Gemmatimonadales bacterium]